MKFPKRERRYWLTNFKENSLIDPGAIVAIKAIIKDLNPYTFPAGPELDAIIHRKLFGHENENERVPATR